MADLWIYDDLQCNEIPFFVWMSSYSAHCMSVGGGTTFLGKRVENIEYESGYCEPLGGELVGTVELLGATTFCCQD